LTDFSLGVIKRREERNVRTIVIRVVGDGVSACATALLDGPGPVTADGDINNNCEKESGTLKAIRKLCERTAVITESARNIATLA
jgi:hypothetical protein